MAKQDVIDAINATIVENGQKGITADSLRNLLIMMTENAGESGSGGGSGDGALRVVVPESLMFGLMIAQTGELSPSSWATMRPEIEAEAGVDLSEYEIAVNASFTHNAAVAQQILAKARAGQGVSVVLDETPYSSAFVNAAFDSQPETAVMMESAIFCGTQPAVLMMNNVKYTPEGEAETGVSEDFICAITPVGMCNSKSLGVSGYPPNMTILLNLDGSLNFEVADTDTDTDTESGS